MSTATETIPAGAEVTVAKNTKKAIKALKGTGIKKVDGISRVVIRKRQGPVFIIESPEVYRTPNGSYIVFGEATEQKQDYQQQLANLAAQQGAGAAEEGAADKSPESIQADLAANVGRLDVREKFEEDEVPDDEVDMTGLDADSVEMIQQQANVSKSKAANALRANSGDVVNALLGLTA